MTSSSSVNNRKPGNVDPTINMALHDGSTIPISELVTVTEELRKSRTSLRRQLGRLQGQLRKTQDDIGNLRAVGTDSEDEALVLLEQNEKKYEEEIVVVQTELSTVQDKLQQVLAFRGSVASRSVQGRSDDGSPVKSTESEEEVPKKDAVGLPEGVRTPRTRKLTFASPPVTTSASVRPLDEDQTPRKPLSSESLGKMRFPKLVDVFRLQAHINAFCRMLVEAGGGRFFKSGSSGGEAKFIPGKGIECSITIAFIETLENKDMHTTALESATDNDYQWQPVIDALVRKYARRTLLKLEYRKRLVGLQFPGVFQCDTFLNKVSTIYHLYESVYPGDASEMRFMIRTIVSRLPVELAQRTLDNIRSLYTTLSGSYVSEELSQDWETMLPLVSSTDEIPSVSDAIRTACRSSEDIQMLSGKSSRKIDSEGDPPRFMSRFGASSTPRLSAIKELRDVESNCASIFFGVGPAAGKPETVEDATEADYVYCGKNKKGKKYCVFGYRQPREQPDLPVSQLHVRPYVVRRVPMDKEEVTTSLSKN
ncbi:hypothetical protein FOZ60_006657 [Perkinsus olseni]|uniref:Uncharacterized protein n=1 Tax=Perkinsus olseni TaxID=32597 RepID=A0A7J6NN15_PEROL|nr:hypothetical protein FOZ60_006657 [Perkinsus olseni]